MSPGEPRTPLKVLHVGSGFRPMRLGGLVAYVEDLIAEQVRRGDQVSYFFSGRYFRWPRGTRLKRWRRDGARMLEVVNSPLYDHGRQPELEVSDPATENLFARVLGELRPDVVHVQELAGLPSSLLDVARESGAPVVMTLQDYFPLCSTFKLLDADGKTCLRREIGADCVASLRTDQRPPNLLLEATMRHQLMRAPLLRTLGVDRRKAIVQPFVHSRLTRLPADQRHELPGPAAFQSRRELNLERLNRTDRLIAMSQRVADIYSELGVEEQRLIKMQLTLAHIERLEPRQPSGRAPVTFATLGGGESVAKGSRLLLQAARLLAAEAGGGRFRLLIFGHCEPEFRRAASGVDEIELRGAYRPDQLSRLLDEVDVGMMPSIWEEAYGFAGIEFIAKGIPVIGNRAGGIVEYVRDGETGWLNRSNSGEGLAAIMRALADDPEQVVEVSRSTRAARDQLVVSMEDHAQAVDAEYRALI